jgi:signal transduction histidine kinase
MAAAAPEVDTSFTLDEALLAQRRVASARRLYTLQIPAVRFAGFVILCAIVALQSRADPTLALFQPLAPVQLALIAANLAYAGAAWALLRFGYGRSGRLDLSLLLFHVDLLVWLPNLHYLEQGNLFFAYFLLVRVVDQVGVGFRRTLYFGHVVTLAYLGYAAWVWFDGQARVPWSDRLGIAATMYLLGIYLAITGLVTQRLRNRTRQAVRTARSLVASLAQKADALEAQAAELAQARRQAEQASLAKSQFLAVTSHELRTPMNGVLGTIELLMETALTRTQQRYVQTAHRSARALLALIDDVLDLSHIESGRLALSPGDVDLRAVVNEAVELAAVTARDKPVEVRCHLPPDLPALVHADSRRLRQLLLNLLHNAVKFTERGTVDCEVTVLDAGRDAVTLRFAVRDSGIGIAADKLESIFGAFAQGDASSTRRHGGSGLGLAIVRELGELMGGRLGVESRLGAGSLFWVELSLPVVSAPPAPIAAPPALHGDEGGAPVRVLVAEDDLINQMVVEEILKVLGCEVEVVGDGQAALDAACGARYDLILMDCHMPQLDGYESARRIRDEERRHGGHTPIVALTADALDADRQRCLDAGMDDFLTKPVSRAQLAQTIQRWTGRSTNPITQW